MDDFNKKESLINGKTLKFALRIIEMVKYVRRKDNENVLTKQVLRSGTSLELRCVSQNMLKVSQISYIN